MSIIEHQSSNFFPLPAREGRVRGDLDPVSHIRRDLLDRPVRSYAEKLQTELHGILRQYDIKTIDDFGRLAQEKKIPEPVVRKYRDLLTCLSDVVRSGKLPESEREFIVEHGEHTLDLREVLQASRDFYTSHNLRVLADALPNTPGALTDAQRERIQFALEQGFTSAVLLPPPELLQAKAYDLIRECASSQSEQLTAKNQYRRPYITCDATKTSVSAYDWRGMGDQGPHTPYLLLYSSGPIPAQTRNLTAEQADTLFKQQGWNGLTLPEYLLLQRKEAESRGDHSFDASDDDPAKSNRTWLLDYPSNLGVPNADWDREKSFLVIDWGNPNAADPHLGSRPTVVVPL